MCLRLIRDLKGIDTTWRPGKSWNSMKSYWENHQTQWGKLSIIFHGKVTSSHIDIATQGVVRLLSFNHGRYSNAMKFSGFMVVSVVLPCYTNMFWWRQTRYLSWLQKRKTTSRINTVQTKRNARVLYKVIPRRAPDFVQRHVYIYIYIHIYLYILYYTHIYIYIYIILYIWCVMHIYIYMQIHIPILKYLYVYIQIICIYIYIHIYLPTL